LHFVKKKIMLLMIQVDISGHPPFLTGPKQFSGNSGFANPQQPKFDKDSPNQQSLKNPSKPQEKKGHRKTKKDTGK
jgi:hypothetical protein